MEQDEAAQQRPQGTQLSPPPEDTNPREMTPQEAREELKEAIAGSNDVLVSATTTMTLFPDTITLDRAKLTITRRTFLRTAEIKSMRIEDLLNVDVSLGPIFGTIKVTARVLNAGKPHGVGPFWRKDAERLKRITQGYIIALQRKIDCSALPADELARMLEQLGEDDHDLPTE